MERSNLVKEFVRIREIFDEGDFDTVRKNLWSLQNLYTAINRRLDKFVKGGENTLEIGAGDIKDMLDLAAPLLTKWEKKIVHTKVYKELWDCDVLDNKKLDQWCTEYANRCSVVAKLRNFVSVMTHSWCLLDAFEKQENQDTDITAAVTSAIKMHLKYSY